ncbi:RNA-binding transcriptional accessory protein [Myxococcota bacterium]|nr:RNA-binding transcriptional accessory protein [Myxococcota bacterium]
MSQTATAFDPVPLLARELNLPARGVAAVVALLNEGNTVPFIARYRKEATGDLDEVQIRTIEERNVYLRELEERRVAVVSSITEQGKMTPELAARIAACTTKAALEDLYLPFKPKRRTRATVAREKGLEPLALRILAQPASGDPVGEAAAFLDAEKGVLDADDALSGARDIVAEAASEHPDVRAVVRDAFAQYGVVVSEGIADKIKEPTKFEMYYDFKEPVATIPSHRFLAVRRGEREGILKVEIQLEPERVVDRIEGVMGLKSASPFAEQMRQAVADAFKRLLAPSVETDIRVDLKGRSDLDAVSIFAGNLRNLLLASPLGGRSVIGVDPGIRTGCKCAAIDLTGRFLDTVTIYPGQGAGKTEAAERDFAAFVRKHNPFAIAVGNGTAGRETETFVRAQLKRVERTDVLVVMVNEAGASVYSASDVAREEFPELDLTIRGAISIGRRLQDPLSELVKIDPKAIGVGQYQHDVHQPLLAKKLEEVVESCVNHVGVELNTASASLLTYVAGIGPSLAKKIVKFREDNGPFGGRKALLKVPGLGPKTFEQCAGFLRVRDGEHPLDASAVHPERYELVERIAVDLGVGLKQLMGSPEQVARIKAAKYIGGDVGELTLKDIVSELEKPGRDPRATFEPPQFRDDVHTLEDLKVDMILEGVVTNVTAFGAFVDIGVHQDGLIHVSQLSHKFVNDPAQVVKAGDRLKVKVLSVDIPRKRISLTARLDEKGERPPPGQARGDGPRDDRRGGGGPNRGPGGPGGGGPNRGPGGGGGKPQGDGFKHNPFAALLKNR